jgi:hypothetical protein
MLRVHVDCTEYICENSVQESGHTCDALRQDVTALMRELHAAQTSQRQVGSLSEVQRKITPSSPAHQQSEQVVQGKGAGHSNVGSAMQQLLDTLQETDLSEKLTSQCSEQASRAAAQEQMVRMRCLNFFACT